LKNRKLKSYIEQRDLFYKHDRKKHEFELNKMKDKLKQYLLQNNTSSSNRIESNIDLISTLKHKSSFHARTTWNNTENTK
jgi:hypothetical protein